MGGDVAKSCGALRNYKVGPRKLNMEPKIGQHLCSLEIGVVARKSKTLFLLMMS